MLREKCRILKSNLTKKKMNKTLIFSLSILILCFSTYSFGTEYNRNVEFKAIKCTSIEIKDIINDTYEYILKVNNKTNETYGTVDFTSEKYTVKFDLPLTDENLKRIPNKVAILSLNISSPHNKIKQLFLILADAYRNLSVSGRSYNDVTGLMSVVKDKLSPYETFWGGLGLRLKSGLIFFIIYSFSMSGILFLYRDQLKIFHVLILIVFLWVVLFIIPWKIIFPGCLITNEQLGLLERYSYIFTFLGCLLTLMIPITVWIIKSISKKRFKSEEQTQNSA